MQFRIAFTLLAVSAAIHPALLAQVAGQQVTLPDPRRPRGIYAVVNVEQEIANQPAGSTPAQLSAYFNGLYQQVLADPAISGIALQVHWDTLNPNAPGTPNPYDWTYVDLAFYRALIWNIENLIRAPKTIQLIVQPGFQSPQWLLGELDSCDPLFRGGTPPSDCGKATFKGFQEQTDSNELPLPWNPIYKSAWRNFLTVLNERYGWNPELVSISVDGPTAASAEIIMPSDATANMSQTFGSTTLTPNEMWNLLFAFQFPSHPEYQNSDQVFTNEWNAATDMFGEIFSGLTLTIATGDGLPNFTGLTGYTIPSLFAAACPITDLDCQAQALILSHFVDPTVGGENAKATQTSGMEASRANPLGPPGDFGVNGVKVLSQETALLTSPLAQILGGAQFNTSFSNDPVGEGCLDGVPPIPSERSALCKSELPASCGTEKCQPAACIPQVCLAPGVTQASLLARLPVDSTFGSVLAADLIPPEQAEYNVLYVYYWGTSVASFFGGTPGSTPAPLNYLQIYSEDILYAEAHASGPLVQVVVPGGGSIFTKARDLLNLASQKLFQIAEPALPLWPFPF
jgi:hypothetical protein